MSNRFLHGLFTGWIPLLLLIVSGTAISAEITIDGVDEDTQRSIHAHIGVPLDDTPNQIRRFVRAVPKNANKAMQALGYYSARYDISTGGTPADPQITITVIPGEPVRITRLIIVINGEAREDPVYMPSVGRIPIVGNGIFTHADYEGTKAVLYDNAVDRGYFDFTFTTSQVRVSREKQSAEITLIADSGFRYTFATVTFKSDYFSDDYLQRYLPFEFGDFYESALLAKLTQQMQNTGYFSKVKVTPLRGEAYGKQVPVIVEVERRDKNYVGIGLGFATDTLWRTKLTWSKPAINSAGHSFDSELGLSKVEQNVSFQYRIPRSRDPLNNYWSIEYGLQNQNDDNDNSSFLSTLNFQHVRKTHNDWRESVFLRWERERSTVAGVEDETDLVLPGISYNKTVSVGQPFPTEGFSTNATLMAGSKDVLSDIDFIKVLFNYKLLKSFTENTTLIFTLQYGAIHTNDFTRVPGSHRFFAGGDRSIRGYKFKSLSPVNPEGDLVGGRYLEVSGLELSYRFKERWSFAVFVDAGRAFNRFDHAHSVGAGLGLRWYSPVGPFRIDLASDVSEDDPGLTLHLSLGPDL